jgi:hypothetical protein
VCFAQKRASVCAWPKNRIAATKMAMMGNPTTTARRHYILCLGPSAGIDRAKCLISLKVTGEQATILSLVGIDAGQSSRPRTIDSKLTTMLMRSRG